MDDITNGFWGKYNKTENQISGFLCIFMYNEYWYKVMHVREKPEEK